MAKQELVRSTTSFTFPLSNHPILNRALVLTVMLSFTLTCTGQQTAAAPQNPDAQNPQQALVQHSPATLVVPAGTTIPLVLTHPMESRSTHRGDQINAEITAPIMVDHQVAIPPGAFLQGKVEQLKRDGTRAEIKLQSASLAFPNGYVAETAGPLMIESEEWTAIREPGRGATIGAIAAPSIGLLAGSLIGHAAGHSPTVNGVPTTDSNVKDTAIGAFVGLAAGGAIALALLLHSRQFLVDSGSPMQMVLQQPLTLDTNQMAAVTHPMQGQPVVLVQPTVPRAPVMMPGAANTGTCYTPGTPGTPSTVIPGTPPIGDSPGTPPSVIPGTPPTPGTPYPCP